MPSLVFIWNSEIIQICLELILCSQAGVAEIAPLVLPFLQAAIVIQLKFLVDDERHNIIPQTFLEQKKTADSAVAVLKRVDPLKAVAQDGLFLKMGIKNRWM